MEHARTFGVLPLSLRGVSLDVLSPFLDARGVPNTRLSTMLLLYECVGLEYITTRRWAFIVSDQCTTFISYLISECGIARLNLGLLIVTWSDIIRRKLNVTLWNTHCTSRKFSPGGSLRFTLLPRHNVEMGQKVSCLIRCYIPLILYFLLFCTTPPADAKTFLVASTHSPVSLRAWINILLIL